MLAGAPRGVHQTTLRHAAPDRPHVAANLGRSAAECWAMESMLERAGSDIDATPINVDIHYALQPASPSPPPALRVLDASRRATGPGPYVFDPEHAQRIDDLALYIQQQHYEEDLAEVGNNALRGPTSRE